MTDYSKFINLNPITKILRFELKPIWETLENKKKVELYISDKDWDGFVVR